MLSKQRLAALVRANALSLISIAVLSVAAVRASAADRRAGLANFILFLRALWFLCEIYVGFAALDWLLGHAVRWVRWHTKKGRRQLEHEYAVHVAKLRATDACILDVERVLRELDTRDSLDSRPSSHTE